MTGKENIDRYVEASKTMNELYDLTDWVADKLGSIYISGAGYYEFKDIERKGDRYEITVDWTVSGETNYGETFTVPADLCEKCFCEETRAEAYAELKKIKDEERRIREAEEKAKREKALAEQKVREKELRRKQYEERKKILDEAIPRMNELKKKSLEEDAEGPHGAADALLCEILDKLGFKELTKIFWEMERWYA